MSQKLPESFDLLIKGLNKAQKVPLKKLTSGIYTPDILKDVSALNG